MRLEGKEKNPPSPARKEAIVLLLAAIDSISFSAEPPVRDRVKEEGAKRRT